jgi:site-specific DNA recombinase
MIVRAALYVRISDDREGEGLGVGRQEQDCRALAERHGWTVSQVYTENDTSAFQRRRVRLPDGTAALRVVRPAFRRLLDDLDSGHVEALVGYDLDRIARDPRDLEDLIDVVEQRERPTKSVTGSLDLSSDAGITMARVMVAVANKASRDTSRRVRRKYVELAAAGKVGNGGLRPFGYGSDRITVVPEEAAVLRDLYADVLAGKGTRTMVRDLAAKGATTSTGRPWSGQALRYNLLSPRNAGLRAHRGTIVGPAVWEPIVDRETWEQVRAVLTRPGRPNEGQGVARRYALTGILRCGLCGSGLKSNRGAELQRFACRPEPGGPQCGGILVRYAPAEEHITELVLARIEQQARLREDAPSRDPSDDLRAQIAVQEARLEALAEAYADEGDALEMRRAGQMIRARIADLRSQITETAQTRRLTESSAVRAEWPSYDIEQRRAVYLEVLDRIDVGSARRGLNRFDPARLTVVWR